MDLRIVNTCNSDCLYCLEQGLRKKRKFILKQDIFKVLSSEKDKEILSFYGGNPLLHPDLLEIISFAKQGGYKNISLLTNTLGLNKHLISLLQKSGLTGISFYFQSFITETHDVIVHGGISLEQLLTNIKIIKQSGLNTKCIIHVNNQNIETVYKDTAFLFKKFGVHNFEFVKYHLVSRAKKNFKDELEYDEVKEKKYLSYLKIVINKFNLNSSFVKF